MLSKKKLLVSLQAVFDQLNRKQFSFNHQLAKNNHQLAKEIQDIKAAITRLDNSIHGKRLRLIAEAPVAAWSWDHRQPAGAANDDTRCTPFVWRSEQFFNRKLNVCDLGCAGGGLVYDFLTQGHFAIGIDGSDINLISGRAHWSVIPKNLYVADITKEFHFFDADASTHFKFDMITAWEVMEHIPEELVEPLINNVKRHLQEDGVFACSIATFPHFDAKTGAVWHVNVNSREWWLNKFSSLGFEPIKNSPFLTHDFPRGSGNPFADDWDAEKNPELGFHLVLRRSPK